MQFALALAQLICRQKTSCQTFDHGVVTYVDIDQKKLTYNFWNACKVSINTLCHIFTEDLS